MHNQANEVLSFAAASGQVAWATPTHDRAGNMTAIPQPDDPAESFQCTYDAWNRLVQVKDGTDTVAEYEYDGLGRRSVARNYTGGTLSETRHFYYSSAWQVLEERVDASTDPERQYVWGVRYIDELVLRDRDTDDDGAVDDERLYALQDANFNVTAVADAAGAVQERYAYTPYGLRAILTPSFGARSSSSHEWTLGHQGLSHEPTGLLQSRARNYHPTLGRFAERDPKEYADGANLYGSYEGNPLALVDPFGTQSDIPWGLIGARNERDAQAMTALAYQEAVQQQMEQGYVTGPNTEPCCGRPPDTLSLQERQDVQRRMAEAADLPWYADVTLYLFGETAGSPPPGEWSRQVPIIGSIRMAVYHQEQGNPLRTFGWTLMAASDVLLIQSLVRAAGKVPLLWTTHLYRHSVQMWGRWWRFASMPARGAAGAADDFGAILIQKGLRGKEFWETLVHEMGHRFLTAKQAWRAKCAAWGYRHVPELKYIEEAGVELVATLRPWHALTFPVRGYVTVPEATRAINLLARLVLDPYRVGRHVGRLATEDIDDDR